MKTLGNKINELRKARMMTQDELAEKLNVSPQAVSKWENDLSVPDISTLVQLADLFGASLDYLLRDKEQAPEESRSQSKTEESAPRKNINKMSLHIRAHDAVKGEDANIKIPLVLIKGKMLKKMIGKYLSEDMDIDIDQLIELIETGALDQIIDAKEANGNTAQIFIE